MTNQIWIPKKGSHFKRKLVIAHMDNDFVRTYGVKPDGTLSKTHDYWKTEVFYQHYEQEQ